MKTQFRFAYILFAVTIAQGYSTENSENDRFKDSLQGRVKSYSEFFYDPEDRFGKVEKSELYDGFQTKYNKKGYKIEENKYNPTLSHQV